jgi:hypothetical protein
MHQRAGVTVSGCNGAALAGRHERCPAQFLPRRIHGSPGGDRQSSSRRQGHGTPSRIWAVDSAVHTGCSFYGSARYSCSPRFSRRGRRRGGTVERRRKIREPRTGDCGGSGEARAEDICDRSPQDHRQHHFVLRKRTHRLTPAAATFQWGCFQSSGLSSSFFRYCPRAMRGKQLR